MLKKTLIGLGLMLVGMLTTQVNAQSYMFSGSIRFGNVQPMYQRPMYQHQYRPVYQPCYTPIYQPRYQPVVTVYQPTVQ